MSHNPRPDLEHPPLDAVDLTDVLHALADPTRLAIVSILYDDPAGRPCGTFPIEVAPSTLSHHFRVLRDAGLIRQEDRGSRRWTVLRRQELQVRFPDVLDALMRARPIQPSVNDLKQT